MTNKWDKRFLELASLVGSWSKDPSTKVGAVIVDQDNRVVSVGFNGFAKGVEDTPERYNDRELKYKLVIHAEENALLHANVPLQGATLYCFPFVPCASCASKIIQSGIKRVVATDDMPARWYDSFKLSLDIFSEAGVEVTIYPNHEDMFGTVGYMCGIDFTHELGMVPDGTKIYSSVEDLKKNSKCVKECGIAKVKTQLVEWVRGE